MKKEEEKIVREIIRKVLNESGFPRIVNILTARVPQVKTIGILTPENPCNEPQTQTKNNQLLDGLRKHLKDSHISHIQVKGKFNTSEKPFILFNISKKDVIEIGKEFKQESVIFGELQKGDEERGYYKFEYIKIWTDDSCETFSPKTTDVRYGILFDKSIQDRNNYYTWIKGRKFVIPFFDDDLLTSPPGGKIEEKLNFVFTECMVESEHGTNLFIDKIKDENKNIKEIINEINQRTQKILRDNVTAKGKWENRCFVEVMLRDIKKIIIAESD